MLGQKMIFGCRSFVHPLTMKISALESILENFYRKNSMQEQNTFRWCAIIRQTCWHHDSLFEFWKMSENDVGGDLKMLTFWKKSEIYEIYEILDFRSQIQVTAICWVTVLEDLSVHSLTGWNFCLRAILGILSQNWGLNTGALVCVAIIRLFYDAWWHGKR